ncbi:MAG: S-adenosylmethionine decarboxylase proenzyme [Bdellovibrionaceae bacterium]|nr:S-adenosylmethionine decarboxylase proenzyme [Pseudobdellovibrionaceae bacterium]
MNLDYEGPEKKLELTCNDSVDFLSYPDQYWGDLLKSCGALILNSVKTEHLKAFLISESSLFVWKNRVLMITCGQTQLIKSAQMLIRHIGKENISSLYFSRKNEHYPDMQKSFARADFKTLKQELGAGKAYRLGQRDSHHLYVFEYVADSKRLIKEHLTEVLIYRISKNKTESFLKNTPEQRIAIEKAVGQIFPEYELDHYWFTPCGYSANAFKGTHYGTVHVTPEVDQNYISFETNGVAREDVQSWVEKICDLFEPQAVDVIFYDNETQTPYEPQFSKYALQQKSHQALPSGFGLNHLHFARPIEQWSTAVDLNLD